ncbi:MAG TPA: hypothetical protein VFA05_01675 [Gaiellaceae bacterium]|nr:hypothetical protein [Gaiellaceae bacterium]
MTPEDRAWEVVRRAYLERSPRPRARPGNRLLPTAAALAVVAAVALAALSPPGRAVFERVGRAVGVEPAATELFSLPGGGRLLAVAHGGVWLVEADGAKRRLAYDDAEWSPHGLYVVATRGDELVAADPHGRVHWTLARPRPRWPRWEGTYVDTRIAYLSAGDLRVVAGDGTGDHLLAAHVLPVPPAWDPARLHTVAYAVAGAVVLRTADGRLVWRRRVRVVPHALEWSSDGRRLAVVGARRIEILDGAGRTLGVVAPPGAAGLDAAFRPGTHILAVAGRLGGQSEVRVGGRLVFAGPGVFGGIAWSPGGGWLLVTWPTANQWLFLHGARVHAVGNIAHQFAQTDARTPAQIDGRWSQ